MSVRYVIEVLIVMTDIDTIAVDRFVFFRS